jgi:hypothetical protein
MKLVDSIKEALSELKADAGKIPAEFKYIRDALETALAWAEKHAKNCASSLKPIPAPAPAPAPQAPSSPQSPPPVPASAAQAVAQGSQVDQKAKATADAKAMMDKRDKQLTK